jgi:uncharacterized protein YjgD (DUF1641 family)
VIFYLDALDLFDRMADLPTHINLDRAKPAGLIEVLSTLRDPDFRKGVGGLLELTRTMAKIKTYPLGAGTFYRCIIINGA